MGAHSIGRLLDPALPPFEDSSTGDSFHPQPVNHGSQAERLAISSRAVRRDACWQLRKACLNPALPRPTTSSVLDSKYTKGREEEWLRTLRLKRKRRRTSLCFPCFAVSGAILLPFG